MEYCIILFIQSIQYIFILHHNLNVHSIKWLRCSYSKILIIISAASGRLILSSVESLSPPHLNHHSSFTISPSRHSKLIQNQLTSKPHSLHNKLYIQPTTFINQCHINQANYNQAGQPEPDLSRVGHPNPGPPELDLFNWAKSP